MNQLADLMGKERGDPLRDAIWLLELVSETKGAEHLKLQSRRLNIFQGWVTKSSLSTNLQYDSIYRVEQKTLLSSVTQFPSGLMGCALTA